MSDALQERIVGMIGKHAQPQGSQITPATPLGDLGIHSLELAEIIFDLEDEYGIEVEMNTSDAWDNLATVGDIVEAVRDLIRRKA